MDGPTKKAFQKKCREAARNIRRGSLRTIQEDYSMIPESFHPLLAEMNGLGMLTFDSQAGEDVSQRAYISSVMPSERARRFSELMNLNSDFVCIVCDPIAFSCKSDELIRENVPVTRAFINSHETNKQNKGKRVKGHWVSDTRFPYYLSKDEYDFIISQALGRPFQACSENLRIVECIDPKWGRCAASNVEKSETMEQEQRLFQMVIKCLQLQNSFKKKREGTLPVPNSRPICGPEVIC